MKALTYLSCLCKINYNYFKYVDGWIIIIFRYGGFPVKLRTHIGKPIKLSEDDTPESVRDRAADGIKELIAANQRLPGSITLALMDRFRFKF